MMKAYSAMTRDELKAARDQELKAYDQLKAKGLKLDMSRGKPGAEQLDLVIGLQSVIQTNEDCFDGSLDCRNYGTPMGIPSCRQLWADLLGVRVEQVMVGGNASLNLMYDTIARAYTHGLLHSDKPWCKLDKVKWLCPVPGYDRHFFVTESFGFEMIPVPMDDNGPDMDLVEELIRDEAVKGIWCVPKSSNPTGCIYSDEVVNRLAAMKPAAKDFLIMWDNAYCIHEFEGDFVPFPDILSLCEKYGNPDMVVEFASTSKVTLPGAGVACMATSEANMKYFMKLMGFQTIGYDKMNQLRHVRFLKDKEHTLALMKRHAAVLAPKFQAVVDGLEREIGPLGFASWSHPKGGYFVSLEVMPGTAKRTVELCKEAGVVMTPAGNPFPYGKDPKDSNIRIAPSLPPKEELEAAVEVLCVCAKLAALEKLLAE